MRHRLRPLDAPNKADDLRAHCAERIARHKIPRYIWMLTEPLPRNASGKFLKKDLREPFWVGRERRVG